MNQVINQEENIMLSDKLNMSQGWKAELVEEAESRIDRGKLVEEDERRISWKD